MKILFFLTTIIYTCNAGISSGYGGNSVQEIEIEPQQLQHVHQIQFDQAPVDIINIQSHGNGAGYDVGHSGFQSEWQPLNDIHSHSFEPQIIKVIHEKAPYSQGRHGGYGFGGESQPQIIKIIEEQVYGSNHDNNGASFVPHQIVKVIEEPTYGGHGGDAFGPYFGEHGSPSQSDPQIIFADPPSFSLRPSSDTSSKSSNPLSSLGSIIPQLLKLLLGGGESQKSSIPSLGGHKAINSPNAGQLINAYGYGGTSKITRGGKLLNSFYKSGRVIESGTLKIASVKKGGKW